MTCFLWLFNFEHLLILQNEIYNTQKTLHSLYGTYLFTTQLRHIPNGISLVEQTYYFPIFGSYLFFRNVNIKN